MTYGIDLGTTNSLWAVGDKCSGLYPSIVDLDTGMVGESQRMNLKAKRSFKVDISMSKDGAVSIMASSKVLETIKRDIDSNDVVISVPAYFTDNQREATKEAARIAGLNVKALINEPTAAAMYLARDSRKISVVFDLGGGTFDISVIDSRFDTYDVQATEGCNIGGDDFDAAIYRHMLNVLNIGEHQLDPEDRALFKILCSKAKIEVQKNGRSDIDLSEYGHQKVFTLDEQTYKTIMKSVFFRCLAITKDVIAKNIENGEVFDIILVGGSTRCPYLREWIGNELGQEPIEVNYDPDKVVAQGAALYASIVDQGLVNEVVSDVTKQLGVALSDGTVQPIILQNSKIPTEETVSMHNAYDAEYLEVALYQGESALASNNEKIGVLKYKYSEPKLAGMGLVDVTVKVDNSGLITLEVAELLGDPVSIEIVR